MPLRLAELAVRFGCELRGDPDALVERVAPLQDATPGALAFLANPKYRRHLAGTRATAVVLDAAAAAECPVAALVTRNPYATYARIAQLLHPEPPAPAGRHASAVVDAGAHLDPSAHVGPHAYVAAGAVIGARVTIGPGSLVLAGARVGADTRLVARVTLCEGVRIGERCLLHPGVVIGADGFGQAPDGGKYVKVPQVGSVALGDDVEVGANTTIDRGALGDTIIEEGVKIDNQVQVAHNCRIGAHSVIAGCTGISGSTTIGRHCVIGGGAGLVGHITIADGVTVSGMTFVTKSITEPGVYSSGLPMMAHADWLKNTAHLRRLNEIARLARGKGASGDDHGTDDD